MINARDALFFAVCNIVPDVKAETPDAREERINRRRAGDRGQRRASETTEERERHLALRRFQYRTRRALMETPDARKEHLDRESVLSIGV